MIDSPITIYLNEKAYEAILHDQKLFKLTNKISTIIKLILINYYTKYEKNIFELMSRIKNTVIYETEDYQFNDTTYINIAWKITKHLCEESVINDNEKRENKRKISLRINNNDFELEDILEECPSNASCSDFLCNIIYAYLKEPQNEREIILHKGIVDSINTAIKNKENIRIRTKSGKKHIIAPKEICTSQEKLYNYLIYQGYNEKKQYYYANTIHIHNILHVQLDHNLSIFQPEIEMRLNRMKNNGVQFSINEETIYKVKLTEQGIHKFNSRYLERPTPLPISNEKKGIYHFNCSKMQFKSYFAPFLGDAIILEPQEIIDEITKEYIEALENYQSINKSNSH